MFNIQGWAKELYPVPIMTIESKDGHVVPPLPILQNLLLTCPGLNGKPKLLSNFDKNNMNWN